MGGTGQGEVPSGTPNATGMGTSASPAPGASWVRAQIFLVDVPEADVLGSKDSP